MAIKDPVLTLDNPLAEFARSVVEIPLLDGVLHTDIDVSSSSTHKLRHGLGRKYLGYIIVRKDANVDIIEDRSNNDQKDQFLFLQNLTASAVNISVWVF